MFDIPALLDKFSKQKILVIGDTIIDIREDVEELGPSVKSDGIVYRKSSSDSAIISYGGAALVVRNLLELGAAAEFITDDTMPETKRRFWCNGKKVFHVDVPARHSRDIVRDFEIMVGLFNKSHDAIVIADYRHGLITQAMAEHFVRSHNHEIPVFVSSQVAQSESNHHWYGSSPTFVVNEKEREYLHHFARNAVVTLGERGSERWGLGARDAHIVPAIKIDAVDTCGAGDAFLAAYVLSGSLEFANTWAGLSCTLRGPNPPTRKMLEDWCNANS